MLNNYCDICVRLIKVYSRRNLSHLLLQLAMHPMLGICYPNVQCKYIDVGVYRQVPIVAGI